MDAEARKFGLVVPWLDDEKKTIYKSYQAPNVPPFIYFFFVYVLECLLLLPFCLCTIIFLCLFDMYIKIKKRIV